MGERGVNAVRRVIRGVALSGAVTAAVAVGLLARRADARDTTHAWQLAADLSANDARAPVPFGVGETLVYDVKFSFVKVGTGRMQVLALDTVRGHTVYHLRFTVTGGIPGFRVDDRYESWIDTATLQTLRHEQRIREGGYRRETTYEMYPERQTYSRNGAPEEPTVARPLDDGSFVYFVRTVPLAVGERREFPLYFKVDRNPVVLYAEARERIEVPAGTFETLKVRPTINAGGIWAEGGEAALWFTEDARRLMVQMKSKLSFGSLNLYLKSYVPPGQADAAVKLPDSTGEHSGD